MVGAEGPAGAAAWEEPAGRRVGSGVHVAAVHDVFQQQGGDLRGERAKSTMEIGPLRTARSPVPIKGTLATQARTLRYLPRGPVQMQITIFPRVRPRSACAWASAIRSRG
ncbi:hypothetical protein GCM10022384_63340 [Streptomyces marokkonensis]|uniref:Uncharacterized protein n=1 Tax=Streptomyces marokkonensis TaxID=324855 RepID=A0ABP7SA49_9ACTN